MHYYYYIIIFKFYHSSILNMYYKIIYNTGDTFRVIEFHIIKNAN